MAKKCKCKKRGRKRKPGRPKGSKNKKGKKKLEKVLAVWLWVPQKLWVLPSHRL